MKIPTWASLEIPAIDYQNYIYYSAPKQIVGQDNIDDLRESPAKYISSRIISETRADVLIIEPNVENHKSFSLTHFNEAYQQADIVVWLVRHKEFLKMPKSTKNEKIELDFCGIYGIAN